jgi:hypothetical protein
MCVAFGFRVLATPSRIEHICHLASLFQRVCYSSKKCRLLGSFVTPILSSLVVDICHLAHLAFFPISNFHFRFPFIAIVVQKHTPCELNNQAEMKKHFSLSTGSNELNNPSSSKNTFSFSIGSHGLNNPSSSKNTFHSQLEAMDSTTTQAQVKNNFHFQLVASHELNNHC